jgi:hypothetical protein
MGEAGQRHVIGHYSWTSIAARMEAMYESLRSKRSRAEPDHEKGSGGSQMLDHATPDLPTHNSAMPPGQPEGAGPLERVGWRSLRRLFP